MSHEPTNEQRAIIEHVATETEKSLMVDARAGSAKTWTAVEAAKGVGQEMTRLALAFNKKNAIELENRLPPGWETKTMNGLGHQAWAQRLGKRLELDTDKVFKHAKEIIGAASTEDEDLLAVVMGLVRSAKSQGLVPNGSIGASTGLVPDLIETWQDFGFIKGLDVTMQDIEYARAVLSASIKSAWKGTIDFDDQIYMSVLFGGQYRKWHTVIVDEAQDLSPLNHRQLIKCTHARLIAIGDPYQAIYAFRGADSNSMTSMMEHFKFDRLGLTQSFRAPQVIAELVRAHVPDFRAAPDNCEGTIDRWLHKEWTLDQIPRIGAVLCRNNAPLMKLAFALIKNRRPVSVMGRDIGASLGNLLDRICGKKDIEVEAAIERVNDWKIKEIVKVNGAESKIETINDRHECLMVLLEASGANSSKAAVQFIKELFSDRTDGLVLSSGHRAKGLEWNWVMHLDPFRLPSKQAKRAEESGNRAPMQQERNLEYVIRTRTKSIYVEASLDDCIDINRSE